MIRAAIVILAAAAGLYAQNPVIAEAKTQYTGYKTNLIKAAEKMPEADYSFKPTPEMRTWGELMMHVAGNQFRNCGVVKGGEQTTPDLTKTKKTDIVATLKASFDVCDAAWDSLNAGNAYEMLSNGRGGERSKLGTMIYNSQHNAEEYGYGSPYMRLRGVIPPSSENAPPLAPPAAPKK